MNRQETFPHILPSSVYSNRQDAVEALAIAARGKVKVHYALKGLSDLKEYVPLQLVRLYNSI